MTCLKFGITGVFQLNMVGNQYADRSSGARHDVAPTPAACSEASVVAALVVLLSVKLCSCDAPGRFGRTIGSSGSRWLTSQFTWNSWCVTSSAGSRSEEHTSELQSRRDLVCRLLLEKKKK